MLCGEAWKSAALIVRTFIVKLIADEIPNSEVLLWPQHGLLSDCPLWSIEDENMFLQQINSNSIILHILTCQSPSTLSKHRELFLSELKTWMLSIKIHPDICSHRTVILVPSARWIWTPSPHEWLFALLCGYLSTDLVNLQNFDTVGVSPYL